MGNPWRGEVSLKINNQMHRLKLTLGALAELETHLGVDSLAELIDRFEREKVRTRDILALLLAGLRGGGWQGPEEMLLDAEIEGGISRAAEAAAELLLWAFRLPEQD